MKLVPVLTTAIAALCLIAFTYHPQGQKSGADPGENLVDAVIGNGGFNVVCPVVPGNGISHDTQITRRLVMLETLLRQRNVSDWPGELQSAREQNLDRLHAYRLRGVYPRNNDYPSQLLPCFIDRDGAICAVGYLVEQSAGHPFAEKINSRYQYATIAQMHDPELDRWIARSGLTRAEVEAIQAPEVPGGRNMSISLAPIVNGVKSDTSTPQPATTPKNRAATQTISTVVRNTPATTAPPAQQVEPGLEKTQSLLTQKAHIE